MDHILLGGIYPLTLIQGTIKKELHGLAPRLSYIVGHPRKIANFD